MMHILVNTYERYDGINKVWIDLFNRNLSLKIVEGILFIFHGYKVLEAVNLLQDQTILKIATKNSFLMVALVDKEQVSRFRVKFFDANDAIYQVLQNTDKLVDISGVVKIIGNYTEVRKLPDIGIKSINSGHEFYKPKVPSVLKNPFSANHINKEIPVSELYKPVLFLNKYVPLPGYTDNPELICTLIFDSTFVELIEKEKNKVTSDFLWDIYMKNNPEEAK